MAFESNCEQFNEPNNLGLLTSLDVHAVIPSCPVASFGGHNRDTQFRSQIYRYIPMMKNLNHYHLLSFSL
ncbi:hypothetical protein DPMN_103444 [Dreissena polymorpha]|uniref:Uncharacterized protein n=1 Tax=Dreissena polymorpha TaxID=45954 RepID=A0A9D4HB55_DREPO|nr:hypothetical protein DPMN_103444 [Dreissena polymorpha]